jgi:hypothetical protein
MLTIEASELAFYFIWAGFTNTQFELPDLGPIALHQTGERVTRAGGRRDAPDKGCRSST